MTPDLLPFAYLAAGALIVLAGQWCSDANRRRTERARHERRREAMGERPTPPQDLEAKTPPQPPRLRAATTPDDVA
jgi:hypothetical protein